MTAALAASAQAAERKAVIEGVDDRQLANLLQRAVGDSREAPANRLEARRRAREAAETVDKVLRSEGWYDARITPDIGDGARPQATVKVELGPRTLITSTEVRFTDPAPEPTARLGAVAASTLDRGAPGRAADVLAAEGRALAQLQSLGYADAKSEPREVFVDHADQSMRPVFHIESGGVVRMDGLRLDKIGRVNPAWIRSLAPWDAGDLYRPDDVAELERRLQGTQVFDTVAVALTPENNADGLRPVSISLTDRPRQSYDLSLGYSTTEGGRLRSAVHAVQSAEAGRYADAAGAACSVGQSLRRASCRFRTGGARDRPFAEAPTIWTPIQTPILRRANKSPAI